jgi:hypothetical protein
MNSNLKLVGVLRVNPTLGPAITGQRLAKAVLKQGGFCGGCLALQLELNLN